MLLHAVIACIVVCVGRQEITAALDGNGRRHEFEKYVTTVGVTHAAESVTDSTESDDSFYDSDGADDGDDGDVGDGNLSLEDIAEAKEETVAGSTTREPETPQSLVAPGNNAEEISLEKSRLGDWTAENSIDAEHVGNGLVDIAEERLNTKPGSRNQHVSPSGITRFDDTTEDQTPGHDEQLVVPTERPGTRLPGPGDDTNTIPGDTGEHGEQQDSADADRDAQLEASDDSDSEVSMSGIVVRRRVTRDEEQAANDAWNIERLLQAARDIQPVAVQFPDEEEEEQEEEECGRSGRVMERVTRKDGMREVMMSMRRLMSCGLMMKRDRVSTSC